ncbi:MAG: hypothetical protein JW801_00820 [Bacteroidales bacterium]|nr:hypothetical protein [Bacteroidales bacterium]
MVHRAVRLVYPHADIPLVLRSSYEDDTYYGVDTFESRRMKIILSKYGCRHSLHTLPGHVTGNLYPFKWDRLQQCYQILMDKKVPVRLNTLEEMIVNYQIYQSQG